MRKNVLNGAVISSASISGTAFSVHFTGDLQGLHAGVAVALDRRRTLHAGDETASTSAAAKYLSRVCGRDGWLCGRVV